MHTHTLSYTHTHTHFLCGKRKHLLRHTPVRVWRVGALCAKVVEFLEIRVHDNLLLICVLERLGSRQVSIGPCCDGWLSQAQYQSNEKRNMAIACAHEYMPSFMVSPVLTQPQATTTQPQPEARSHMHRTCHRHKYRRSAVSLSHK